MFSVCALTISVSVIAIAATLARHQSRTPLARTWRHHG